MLFVQADAFFGAGGCDFLCNDGAPLVIRHSAKIQRAFCRIPGEYGVKTQVRWFWLDEFDVKLWLGKVVFIQLGFKGFSVPGE